MICSNAEIVEIQKDEFAADYGNVTTRRKSADTIVSRRPGHCVIDINEIIGGEIRIERHAKQTTFARRINGHREERRREQRSIFYHPQLSALMADEQTTIRSKVHRRWTREPAAYHGFAETLRQSGPGRR